MVFIVFRYQPKLIIIKYFREIYDSKNEKKNIQDGNLFPL